MSIELYKPNELIGAIDQIEVSRTAKHLLNFFLQYSQHELHKYKKLHPDSEVYPTEFEVDVYTINGLADIHTHDYERLKLKLIKLMQPVILRDDPKRFIALTPITAIDIDVPRGMYKFELQPKVVMALANTDYFTKLKLSDFNGLESKHSIVIYEWLKRYETSPHIPKLTVEDLRNITHTANMRKYNNFTDIKLRILDVAVNEISEKTPYTVTYETIKTRTMRRPKVTAIKFTMTKKKSEKEIIETSGIVSKDKDIAYVSDRYQKLCEMYIQFGFCSKPEEFYKATYDLDLDLLSGFFIKKKDIQHKGKLKWLYATVKDPGSKLRYRRSNQQAYYKSLFDKEDWQTQGLLEENQKTQGFLEQVLQLQKRHNDNKKIDIERWL
ncbi:MAG: replication initiation protein [Clostridia bacterium]|nr:replication initiation protein [Clostridia bacterium]